MLLAELVAKAYSSEIQTLNQRELQEVDEAQKEQDDFEAREMELSEVSGRTEDLY